MKIQIALAILLGLISATQSASAAGVDRVAAIHIAEKYVSSGLVKDKYGRNLEISFVTFKDLDIIGRVYSVRLDTGSDRTDMGGYRTICSGSVQVYANNGEVLSSDFTCVDSD